MPAAFRLAIIALGIVVLAPASWVDVLAVYDDQLRNGFDDWSWAAHDLQQTAVVHSGTNAISMQPANWEGLYFHRTAGVDVAVNGTLELWVHGGASGGQQIRFAVYANGAQIADAEFESFVTGGAIPAGAWAKATVPLPALGVTGGTIDGIVFQADMAAPQPAVYFDDLLFLDTAGPPAPVQVAIDPEADRHPISPLIYGVNLGTAGEFAALPYPARRWGGNHTTRYNYTKDATNRANDWFFISLPAGDADSTDLPSGSAADDWMDETLAAGAEAIVTVPTIGWTTKDRRKRWGFSVAKYGAQQETECTTENPPPGCAADAGNGLRPAGTPVTGNDPHDTSVEIGPPFVSGWLGHITGRLGSAASGGVAFYALDNEPALWNSTHRDVHPQPVTYDELWTRTLDYAAAVKAADPSARVLGPAAWGWCEYFYSAADGCAPGPDMAAHGGTPLLEWYLAQNRQRELATGTRPVDYLDVHYYPQADGVALTDDESVAARRLRSLKSLYDPSYVDESWIAQPVALIPRMREWIAARSPGVKLAIAEYNWGGDTGILSGLAEAEALAIFGREGVDLAARWVAPQSPSKVLEAFRLYLDYDGLGHSLEGESVRAASANVDDVGAYAIRLSGADLAVLLFNKATSIRTADVSVEGGVTGQARLFRFDASTPLGPAGTFPVAGSAFSVDLPPRSATLAIVPRATVSAGAPPARMRLDVYPTPFRSEVSVRFDMPEAGAITLEVSDAGGRLVRRTGEARGAGSAVVAWDGHDAAGRVAPSGIYFLSVRAGTRTGAARVVKMR